MPTLHDMFSESIDGRADALAGAAAPASTLDRARGARRRFAAASTGASLLAVSALGLGALTLQPWNRADEPAASTSPDPATVDPATLPTVEIPGYVDSMGGELESNDGITCGDRIDGERLSDGDWSLSMDQTAIGDNFPSLSGTIAYSGPDREAFVESGRPVLVHDGVVVAVGWTAGTAPVAASAVTDGQTRGVFAEGSSWDTYVWCDEASPSADPSSVVRPAGDYTQYFAVRASMSPALQATSALYMRGYAVAPLVVDGVLSTTHYAWSPGSPDCGLYGGGTNGSGVRIVQCTSDLPAGVSVDPATGAVTAPYNPAVVGEPFDATLIYEGATRTLASDVLGSDLGYTGAGDSAQPEVLSCDASAPLGGGSLTLANNVTTSDVLSGATVPVFVDWLPSTPSFTGEADLPASATMWVKTAYGPRVDGVPTPGPIVARATVTFSSTTVPLDRMRGAAEVDVTVTDLQPCEGYSTSEPWFTDSGTTFILDAPLTFRWNDGTVDTDPLPIMAQP